MEDYSRQGGTGGILGLTDKPSTNIVEQAIGFRTGQQVRFAAMAQERGTWMVTIFSTAKPFKGHFAIIQRNAIKSWTLLHPDCEVILFGDEEGAAEVVHEYGISHEPRVERNKHGIPFLNSMFDRAQEIARHDLLCYVNCDILLMSDFRDALQRVSHWRRTFLMIGRRWNTDIAELWDFDDPDWERWLRAVALQEGKQAEPWCIDYFVFSRGLYYRKIPPFLIGFPRWDNWLIWKTRSLGHAIVDASSVVTAVHQNHDYSHIAHLPAGAKKIPENNEGVKWNDKLAGNRWHLYTTKNTTHKLHADRFQRNWLHWLVLVKRSILRLGRAFTSRLERTLILLRGQRRV